MGSHAIPQGSTVLVTGLSGFIGAHVGDQLWRAGFLVRGAVRSAEKAKPIQEYADSKYGKGVFESIIVEDFTKPGAFDEAVKGVSGVVHLAMSLNPQGDSYDAAMHQAVEGALSILKSAQAHGGPNLKRVILTSSSLASGAPVIDAGKYQTLDSNSWNDAAAEQSKKDWKNGPTYAASKYESEKAVWAYVEKEKPQYTVTALLPNANFGPKLPFTATSGSTYNWIDELVKGDYSRTKKIPAQWFIDVRDDALLHVIALTAPEVKNERFWVVSAPFTWNTLLSLVQRFRPGTKVEYLQGADDTYDHSWIDNTRARELLKKYADRELRTLDETLKDQLDEHQ